uniref:Uncharacterized protein n=1 Tax=Rhizophora mucronata TaxID=61149 RepID=A0A2P2QBV0_RHIMU
MMPQPSCFQMTWILQRQDAV